MSTIIAGYFPAEIKVAAGDLRAGDTLLNGDKVVEVHEVDLFPGAVFVRFEVDGMTNSMRVHGTSQYRVMREFPVDAQFNVIAEEPVLAVAA